MMFGDKIRTIVNRVTKEYEPEAIIVFGSVARGEATEESDLGIAIIMDSDLSEHERNVRMRVCIGPIGMAADLLVFTP
ncbi:nucleotidyltransferase domain-containing protein [Methanomassiliicoccales archaeon LGM-RCC1]|nr:nucleotidyltransferase domain-containing protein [Methanomassiliicoccales archaeon LGM-RCC1]